MNKESKQHAEVIVIGSGPGGYSAAFRAADLGLKTILVERYDRLGGVCLNVGCIPSKALLHAAKVIDEADYLSQHGISFGEPSINASKLAAWKEGVVKRLTDGLAVLAKQRKVEVVQGYANFTSDHEVEVTRGKESVKIGFDQCIIAVGSSAITLPFIPEDKRIMDSTDALLLEDINANMLVLGGGIIGLEMGTVYRALGAKVTVVEMMDQLIPGCDADLVRPLARLLNKQFEKVMLKTKVTHVEAKKEGLMVSFEGENAPDKAQKFDRILVAVGRAPNGKLISAEKAGVKIDERGYIPIDSQMRTNVNHIFAIGDVARMPLLAHKSVHEGRLAAEVAAGKNYSYDARSIPSVAYTDPEVAWTGVTENEAKKEKLNYGKGVFPWAASGRSLSMGRDEGMTKIIFDKESHRIIGAGIVGQHAGDLISEMALAIEMGCDAEDIALTIHPHPTLSETLMMASEVFEGTVTDIYIPKREKK